jgi:putative ABC transport system substrate-binding protein
MRRREFIACLGSAALAAPRVVGAQSRIARIGVLLVSGPEFMGPYREALRDLGYVESKTVQFEVRSADGQRDRLPQLASELVRSKVDIIIASLTPAVTAARNATRDIPIVMAPAGDPVATGLIDSLARPGGNITGLAGTASELGAKNLELIRELVPAAQRVAVLANRNDPFTTPAVEQIHQGARPIGLTIQPLTIGAGDELEDSFAAMARQRADAVIVMATLSSQSKMVELALKHRLPTLSTEKSMTHAGALVSYSASVAERGREIAAYVDKILKGARPADLPVQQPSKFELVINLKTAKALNLDIPLLLQQRADEVIE